MKVHPLILVVCAVVPALLVWLFMLRQNKVNSERYESIIQEKNDLIDYHVTDKGKIVAEKLAAQATAKQLAEAYPQVVKELKELDIKFKDLKAFVKNEIAAHGSGNAEVHNHYTLPDSTGKRYPYWELKASDGYLDFKAQVIDSLHSPYQYVYHDTITTAIAVRKKNWFAKEELFATTTLRNPNAKTVASTNLLVDSYKDKRWCVYGGVGYGATFRGDQFLSGPTVSVGVGYALLKF